MAYTAKQRRTLLLLYQQGNSIRKAAVLTGVSESWAYRTIRTAGVKRPFATREACAGLISHGGTFADAARHFAVERWGVQLMWRKIYGRLSIQDVRDNDNDAFKGAPAPSLQPETFETSEPARSLHYDAAEPL